MSRFRSRPIPAALPTLGLLALLAACDDGPSPVAAPGTESRDPIEVQALSCVVELPAGTVSCAHQGDEPAEDGTADIILNPDGRWVRLATSNIAYANGVLTLDVTVLNLTPQTLGVAASGQYDGNGVSVFFPEPPVVMRGTGTVTPTNTETGQFTRPGQPFYRYPQTLPPNAISAPRQWSFDVDGTVTRFRADVRVSASVQRPRGWVEIPHGSILRMQRNGTRALKAVVRDALGRDVTATAPPIAWTVDDASVATVEGSTVTGASVSGLATLTATSGSLSASARLTVGAPFVQVTAGWLHTCALTDAGRAYCWGYNYGGRLGDGSRANRYTPAAVGQDSARFVQISAGKDHTCAVDTTGQAWCWGASYLGNDDRAGTPQYEPVAVHQGATRFVQITPGESHTCARSTTGQLHCWGSNYYVQLGTTERGVERRLVPGPVHDGGRSYLELTAGNDHNCARATNASNYCWGRNYRGELGDGTLSGRNVPVRVDQGTARYAQISAGGHHTCARSPAGLAYCWGLNEHGQMGVSAPLYGSTVPEPVSQGAVRFAEIRAGADFTCARTSAGQAWCWGRATNGFADSRTPVAVPQASIRFVELTSGGFHRCGRTAAGRVYCWGDNQLGSLGDGTDVSRGAPVAVQNAP
jgi:hypothetical protein